MTEQNEELLLAKDVIDDIMSRNSAHPITTQVRIVLKAQLAEAKPIIEKQIRWSVGEELCCLIGNKMLEDMEAGKLLGKQLEEYMKNYLKGVVNEQNKY